MILNNRIEAFRINQEVKNKLLLLAKKDGRTLTNYLQRLLTQHVEKES